MTATTRSRASLGWLQTGRFMTGAIPMSTGRRWNLPIWLGGLSMWKRSPASRDESPGGTRLQLSLASMGSRTPSTTNSRSQDRDLKSVASGDGKHGRGRFVTVANLAGEIVLAALAELSARYLRAGAAPVPRRTVKRLLRAP